MNELLPPKRRRGRRMRHGRTRRTSTDVPDIPDVPDVQDVPPTAELVPVELEAEPVPGNQCFMVPRQKDSCCIIPKAPPVFILGGRFGDIILLSGCMHEIWRRTGLKPVMFTSVDCISIYDGMSFVDPRPVRGNWFDCAIPAKAQADAMFGHRGVVVQFWADEPSHADTIGFGGQNVVILQSHGKNWGVNINLDPDFGTSMARRMGFARQEWLSLLPVFDRRNREREQELVKRFTKKDKPLLLYNFTGISSPFGYTPEVMRLLHPYRGQFNMVDIGTFQCYRIYDLLGLYDQAVGLITVDTATAHLAAASRCPTIWLTVPGWGRSIPRGNVALHVQYDQTPNRLAEIDSVLKRWLS